MNSNKTTEQMDVLTRAMYALHNKDNIILIKSVNSKSVNYKSKSHKNVIGNIDSENLYRWLVKKQNHIKYIESPLGKCNIIYTYFQ